MGNLGHKIISSALGATGGLLGASSLGQCAGASCSSCLGCVGAGAVLAAAIVINSIRKTGKEGQDALAQGND